MVHMTFTGQRECQDDLAGLGWQCAVQHHVLAENNQWNKKGGQNDEWRVITLIQHIPKVWKQNRGCFSFVRYIQTICHAYLFVFE